MTEQKTETVVSMNVADMTLDQLVQLSQGLGRKADSIREQRAYLKTKIAERLAAGERDGAGAGDAAAPGAVIDVSAT